MSDFDPMVKMHVDLQKQHSMSHWYCELPSVIRNSNVTVKRWRLEEQPHI